MRAIRDYLRQDTEEILVDTQEIFEKTKQYICQVRPDFISKIKLYQNKTPLFSFYQIDIILQHTILQRFWLERD